MNAAQLTRRLDALSTHLWQQAIRLEKLHDRVDDYVAASEAIQPPKRIAYEAGIAAIDRAARRLRDISQTLSQADAALQEAAWAAQEAQDALEELIPAPR